jgi:hypothetical protein
VEAAKKKSKARAVKEPFILLFTHVEKAVFHCFPSTEVLPAESTHSEKTFQHFIATNHHRGSKRQRGDRDEFMQQETPRMNGTSWRKGHTFKGRATVFERTFSFLLGTRSRSSGTEVLRSSIPRCNSSYPSIQLTHPPLAYLPLPGRRQ